MKYDFSGYATKVGLKCSDGRVIRKDAFKQNDGQKVPLVWQHVHNDVNNVLGHAILENRPDGVYAYCVFNDSEAGKHAKILVEHGDITSLSIHANELKQQGSSVLHGNIREVSLVLAAANPGALIDNLFIEHSDGSQVINETEAIIYTGDDISTESGEFEHGADSTIGEIFDTLNEEQKDVVYAMLAHALEMNDGDDNDVNLDHSAIIAELNKIAGVKGGKRVKKNLFDKKKDDDKPRATLTHAQIKTIFADAQKCGSLKESFLSHAQEYGIENIDYLFPDAKTVTPTPELIKRDTEWVAGVISGTRHTPFSRIKSTAADITADEARAKGYVKKGELKKEEVIKLLKRITTPTTVYKKQKLDRDDIIDITDLDVVAFLKAEMRLMLDEELARAVLVGDGREAEDEDKINEENIRPIYTDDDMYAYHYIVDAGTEAEDLIDEIIKSRYYYKGAGNPVLYTDNATLTAMLLLKDTTGRRLYSTITELASALRVSRIVEVPVMENLTRVVEDETLALKGIIVNLSDYTMGADKGGAINMFDDFDIDYNQYKYLLETRCSGALTRPRSAIVIEQVVEEEQAD